MNYSFPDVTLLVTHYNRSSSLEHLLTSYQQIGCQFGDIVVSDDGSKPEHLQRLRELQQTFHFQLITTPQNRGLGNNINKGQDAVKTPLTLYVQEDFEPSPDFPLHFTHALELMDANKNLDYIRFYAYIPYPYLRPYAYNFSEIYLPPFGMDYTKIYAYSDHPHLRRSTFLQKFGRYAEGIKGDRMEYRMCISFLQKGGKGLFYNDYQSLFTQRNSAAEPSTMTRSSLTESSNKLIGLVRDLYRQIKYNYDIHFMRT
ncbi:glycosyl transferase family 2 [Siphonobacter sp. BAB-5405]|uniref:glycosyltransferase n=1 Tax=Siphonobacter sp. BAB-5405 TaxID=1864825 RepID=UPI000C80BEF4|nr:glycosyltransferase [Siphonobacter sp. BAB-5405]PMD96176.1 glycosyl transferase family 2 [Siphonobacter sp. BAB-5405]